MKKVIKLVVLGVAVVVGLGFIKNSVTQTILSSAISAAAHVPVKIGSVNLSFLSASIRLKNVNLSNPPGFPDKTMAQIPQLFIDFEPRELFQGRAHFKQVTLDLKEIAVVRNKDGKLNVDSLKPSQEDKRRAVPQARPSASKKPPKLMIDKLSLSIGRVVYKDYGSPGAPSIQTFEINIKDREYEHIDNPASIVSILMSEALTRTTLSGLVNLDVNAFKNGGIQALSKGLGVVGDSTEVVQSTTKKLLSFLN